MAGVFVSSVMVGTKMHTCMYVHIQGKLVNPLQFIFKGYGGLMHLADKQDIHWYLYVILVLGNCGR